MATIYFKPSGVSIEVRDGTTVFAAAAAAEVPIASQCGGRCACALCRVRITEGVNFVSPMKWDEADHMGNCFHLTGERLSCQTRVYGDVTVEIDESDVSDRPRSRYIPPALVRKREKMEKEEELRRVRTDGSSASARGGPRKSGSKPSKGPSHGASTRKSDVTGSSRRRKRSSSTKRRSRNPGSLKPGSTRPPPGFKGKQED